MKLSEPGPAFVIYYSAKVHAVANEAPTFVLILFSFLKTVSCVKQMHRNRKSKIPEAF